MILPLALFGNCLSPLGSGAGAKQPAEVMSQHSASENRTDESFVITSVSADGYDLKIDVQYSGGCSVHTFELVVDKDSASELTARLLHNSNGDRCKRLVTETLNYTIPVEHPGLVNRCNTIRIERWSGQVSIGN